ncbi:acyltransferase [Chryseobacterium indologenes]|uniref:acyltransferase family protein n=1 Tax=Chryseobacterium indologenes TaxID=253 RepID=UPI000F50ACA3|nr:acyltransferase [Chryseobacterium indologenes]AYZ35018.1 acyltransferase [Chryseobacterium indologenes]MBF6643764.1 acyltransferase [Chryseobacterium indologenes]MBU3047638.1 acyltransferase [Chryseobacterium indologenes]MEB4761673.1 acyltransferase [Chryseobacterium indologenes]QQQ72504.1 acyltransferase [Chryseobacterium indologenes]
MTTEYSQRFHGLDHLRSMAIILVLLYHYRAFKHPGWIDSIGKFGWTGVDLFFVLSGFLISSQLLKEMENRNTICLKTFYIKRFFRIVPPYLLTLLLYFSSPFFREREALPPLWKFLTFTQNYGLDVISKGTFSHAWSLCIEEQFYLFLPLLLLVVLSTRWCKYPGILIMAVIAFSIISRFIIWNIHITRLEKGSMEFWRLWYMKIYYSTHTRLDGLAIGVLIGYLMQYSLVLRKLVNTYGNLLFVIGMVSLGISFWICNDQASEAASIYGFTAVAVSYGIMVLAAISKSSFLSRSKSYVTGQLAALSYAMYLSHKGIIHMTQTVLEYFNMETSDNICILLCLLLCIAGGIFFRFVIEKPSSKIKFKLLMLKKKD